MFPFIVIQAARMGLNLYGGYFEYLTKTTIMKFQAGQFFYAPDNTAWKKEYQFVIKKSDLTPTSWLTVTFNLHDGMESFSWIGISLETV